MLLGGRIGYRQRQASGVTRVALSRILNGSAGISAEMTLRLSDALGTTPELWATMQAQHDLWQASKKRRKKIARLIATFMPRTPEKGRGQEHTLP